MRDPKPRAGRRSHFRISLRDLTRSDDMTKRKDHIPHSKLMEENDTDARSGVETDSGAMLEALRREHPEKVKDPQESATVPPHGGKRQ